MLANASGWEFVFGTVRVYPGPPIVAVGSYFVEDSARWTSLVAFADVFSAPIIACDVSELARVRSGLMDTRRWWSTNHLEPPGVLNATTRLIDRPPFCGPILLAPRGPSEDSGQAVWDWAATLARSSRYHRFGAGMMAVSSIEPYLSPPIYPLPSATIPAQLKALADVWRLPPEPSKEQYAAMVLLNQTRPGIVPYIHPAMLPYLKTSR